MHLFQDRSQSPAQMILLKLDGVQWIPKWDTRCGVFAIWHALGKSKHLILNHFDTERLPVILEHGIRMISKWVSITSVVRPFGQILWSNSVVRRDELDRLIVSDVTVGAWLGIVEYIQDNARVSRFSLSAYLRGRPNWS